MPKKIKFESFKYQLLIACAKFGEQLNVRDRDMWIDFVKSIEFNYENGKATAQWSYPKPGIISHGLRRGQVEFYIRGDTPKYIEQQTKSNRHDGHDEIKYKNSLIFSSLVEELVNEAGLNFSK